MGPDRGVDVFNADVAQFDLAIVRVDVDGFTGKLTVHDVVLVQKLECFEHLLTPVADHVQSQRFNLLQVPKCQ